MRALILALTLVATPAAAADQFDLVCKAKGAAERYRVDLARGEWCAGACQDVRKIVSSTPALLRLASKERQFASDVEALTQVDRTTGEWTDISVGGGFDPVNISGKCERAPFGGFPVVKQKF